MHRLEILVTVFVSAIALTFALMPIDWCLVPHRRELGALICFLVFLAYVVLVGAGNAKAAATPGTLVGILFGLAIASIFAFGPGGFIVSVCLGTGLGRFGIDWAA